MELNITVPVFGNKILFYITHTQGWRDNIAAYNKGYKKMQKHEDININYYCNGGWNKFLMSEKII